MKYLFYITFLFSVFSFIDLGIFDSPQILIQHPLIVISLIILLYKYKSFPKIILQISLLLFLIGSVSVFQGNNTWGLLIKVSLGLLINTLFFYFFIKIENLNIEKIFKAYMYGALCSSIIVLIQITSYEIGFIYGYDVSLIGIPLSIEDNKVLPAALFREPSHYASALSPAIFISIHNIIRLKDKYINIASSFIVIISAILTYSSTGYIAILFSFIIIAINYRNFRILFFATGVGIISFLTLYNTVNKFKVRIDDSKSVFIDNKVKLGQNKEYNGSTMVLYNNMIIASKNFIEHPIFGTGLGSHLFAHDKYTLFKDDVWWVNLNKEDANSLFLRIMSEIGIVGIIFTFIFLLKFWVPKHKSNNENNWLISNAILILFVANLLRQGNYMIYGFTCFVLMYYFVYKLNSSTGTTNKITL